MDTKIVLSFAMIYGGHSFSIWLRDRLMAHYGLHRIESVYLDTIASRQLEASATADLQIRPDTRVSMASPTGAHPIGATRNDWDDLFQQALASAHAVVVTLTGDYFASGACLQEAGQIRDEAARRTVENRPPLRIVVLNLARISTETTRLWLPTATIIDANQVDGGRQGVLWDIGAWKVTDAAFNSLTQAIGTLHTAMA